MTDALDRGSPLRARLLAPSTVAATLWAANFLMLSASGQRYSIRVLYAGWQFLPADALRDDPLGSVWNLHIQPPGWNLLAGAVAAWSPLGLVTSHRLISLALGATLAAAVAATVHQLGASRRVAVALTALATMNTQVMRNAFEPRYDLAVATLLALLVWSLSRQSGRDTWSPVATTVIATGLVMTRALYHPVWLVATVALLLWSLRASVSARQLAIAVSVPVLLVGGWMVKNEVVVGRATVSTWTGMNLLRSVAPAVEPSRIAELNAEGDVSGVALAGTFQLYQDYAAAVPACVPDPDDHAVLAEPYRPIPADLRGPLDGTLAANFNFACYLPVYERAGDDARALIRAEPGAWFRARAWAVNNWFQIPTSSSSDDSPLWKVENAISRAALLGAPHPGVPSGWRRHELWAHTNPLSLTLFATTVALLAATWRALRDRADPGGRHRSLVLAVTSGAVLWTAITGLAFELGEQERFRSAIDPLVLAIGGWALVEWLRSWAARGAQVTVDARSSPS